MCMRIGINSVTFWISCTLYCSILYIETAAYVTYNVNSFHWCWKGKWVHSI